MLLRTENGACGVSVVFSAAVVAAVVDEFLGGGEVGLRGLPRVRLLAEEEAGAVEVFGVPASASWACDELRASGLSNPGPPEGGTPNLPEDGALGVGEFSVAAVATAVVDEFLGGSEVVRWRFPPVRLLAEEKRWGGGGGKTAVRFFSPATPPKSNAFR